MVRQSKEARVRAAQRIERNRGKNHQLNWKSDQMLLVKGGGPPLLMTQKVGGKEIRNFKSGIATALRQRETLEGSH